ncbi:MAG: hypothetical protein KF805_03060 [Phycisphaeraceae bacterium]|nr:hypothetical protein [Phycisphaeraceae bacterium]
MNQQTPDSNAFGNAQTQDPKPGPLGAHPLGVGVGAVGAGAAAGAAGGAIGGPVGAVAGAVVGAVVGGMAGSAVAEAIDPTFEGNYWREKYSTRPYADSKVNFEEYSPAYRYGWESFGRSESKGKTFDNVEADLGRGWDKAKGTSTLAWDKAKPATRDAWDRVESASRSNKPRTT